MFIINDSFAFQIITFHFLFKLRWFKRAFLLHDTAPKIGAHSSWIRKKIHASIRFPNPFNPDHSVAGAYPLRVNVGHTQSAAVTHRIHQTH